MNDLIQCKISKASIIQLYSLIDSHFSSAHLKVIQYIIINSQLRNTFMKTFIVIVCCGHN